MLPELAALIPAAGASSRLCGPGGQPKPCLPLGAGTVLGRCVGLFREAGVTRVVVTTADAHGPVARLAGELGAHVAVCPYREHGMLASIQAGLAVVAAGALVAGVFVLPADMPLVRPSSVRLLARLLRPGRGMVLHPCVGGRRGHPPLISAQLLPGVMAYTGEGGLKGALVSLAAEHLDVETHDKGVRTDLDTPDDYARAAKALRAEEGREECPDAQAGGSWAEVRRVTETRRQDVNAARAKGRSPG